MPKIKDLGITTLAFARPEREGARGRGYWLCTQSCGGGFSVQRPDEPCHPTPPQCHPTPQCDPTIETTEPEKKKEARGVPHHAVAQIKQQIHQISRQLHN